MQLACLKRAGHLAHDHPVAVRPPDTVEAHHNTRCARRGRRLFLGVLHALPLRRLERRLGQRLERLAALLAPEASWQLSLALESSDPQARLLRQRFSAISLRGFMPSRVGLHGAAADQLVAQRPGWWPEDLTATALPGSPDALALETFLALPRCSARPHLDPEASVLRLPMPGVDKAQLDVRQIGAQMVLIAAGQRRLVTLPEALQGQSCSGARLEQGWLELRFS